MVIASAKGEPIVGNGVTMFELPVSDISRAQKFYREAFGWYTAPVPGLPSTAHSPADRTEIHQRAILEAIPTSVNENGFPVEPGMITGILTQRVAEITSPTIILEVEDIEEALRRVEVCGGTTITGRHEAGETGSYAYVADTEGNVLCLWKDVVPGIRVGVSTVT